MLQTSQSLLHRKTENIDQKYGENMDIQNIFDMVDGNAANDGALLDQDDKNPIKNKRILLKTNFEQSNNLETDNVLPDLESVKYIDDVRSKIYKSDSLTPTVKNKNDLAFERIPNDNIINDKIKLIKQYPITAASSVNSDNTQNHGRIVVYGDSNCLDSTHIEKPCFWLLDALLEYTMSSHLSNILKDLNRSPNIEFLTSSQAASPKRLPQNNLHLYSKVLSPSFTNNDGNIAHESHIKSSSQRKRPIPKCLHLRWDVPIFLNISASNDFHLMNGRNKEDIDNVNMIGESSLRRKLESQKGEVRRC